MKLALKTRQNGYDIYEDADYRNGDAKRLAIIQVYTSNISILPTGGGGIPGLPMRSNYSSLDEAIADIKAYGFEVAIY